MKEKERTSRNIESKKKTMTLIFSDTKGLRPAKPLQLVETNRIKGTAMNVDEGERPLL
jgi:hypothetical protein